MLVIWGHYSTQNILRDPYFIQNKSYSFSKTHQTYMNWSSVSLRLPPTTLPWLALLQESSSLQPMHLGKHETASGPLALLFPWLGTVFLQVHSLPLLTSLLKQLLCQSSLNTCCCLLSYPTLSLDCVSLPKLALPSPKMLRMYFFCLQWWGVPREQGFYFAPCSMPHISRNAWYIIGTEEICIKGMKISWEISAILAS